MSNHISNGKQVTTRKIFNNWWPLAASWLFMGLELPALSAIVARMAEPEINLAAYGGVVFPIALIIESPIIMLLAASTALSKDLISYRKIKSFMMWISAVLTSLHVLVAFTPLYYFVVDKMIGAPKEIIEPARIGLMIMLPWTWAIAYRRFNQGVLIRFGHSRAISIGTAIRLSVNILVLVIGYKIGNIQGIIVATSAVAFGVTSEAIFIGIRTRPVIQNELIFTPTIEPPLTFRGFIDFYVPLAMTSLLLFIIQPIGSAALSRMPQPLESLAIWPVVTGIIFLMGGMGIAFNEVVISLIAEQNSFWNLKKFTAILTLFTSLIILIINVTPIAELYFSKVSALPPDLTRLAKTALWLSLLMPGLNTLQSWYQGMILFNQKTRGITEAVIIFILIITGMYWIGVTLNNIIGLYVGIGSYVVGMLIQTIWLWYRSKPAFQIIQERDLRVIEKL
jgi:hypothetical protein